MQFNEADFHRNTLVLAGLSVVQAVNLSAWLSALVVQSFVFLPERNGTVRIVSLFQRLEFQHNRSFLPVL